MRLIDQLLAAEDFVVENAQLGASFRLKNSVDFQLAARSTPHRYILDTSATKLCTEVAVRDARMIHSSLDILRLPAEQFWIEWMERPRFETLRSEKSNLPDPAPMPTDARAGALVQSNPGGRSGVAWLFTGYKGTADLCPLYLEFSTDASIIPPPRQVLLEAFSMTNPDFPALKSILTHCLVKVEPSWLNYCQKSSQSIEEANQHFEGVAGKIWFDWPFIVSFLLLNQIPAALSLRQSDLEALNKARVKRGKPSLLEHLEVSASLTDRSLAEGDSREGKGGVGKRLHHVRGHLVRRNTRVFWRSPHLRGNPTLGAIATRTVQVRA